MARCTQSMADRMRNGQARPCQGPRPSPSRLVLIPGSSPGIRMRLLLRQPGTRARKSPRNTLKRFKTGSGRDKARSHQPKAAGRGPRRRPSRPDTASPQCQRRARRDRPENFPQALGNIESAPGISGRPPKQAVAPVATPLLSSPRKRGSRALARGPVPYRQMATLAALDARVRGHDNVGRYSRPEKSAQRLEKVQNGLGNGRRLQKVGAGVARRPARRSWSGRGGA
jgi:hypothetical protein